MATEKKADAGKLSLHQKLLAIRKDCTYLQKKNQIGNNQYKAVASSQVIEALRAGMDAQEVLLIPRVTGHNLLVKVDTKDPTADKYKRFTQSEQHTYFTELDIVYTWVNCNDTKDTIECPWYSQGVDIAGEKGPGKAFTYAEKSFLLKFFNIATDKEDPDVHLKPEEPKAEPNAQPDSDVLHPAPDTPPLLTKISPDDVTALSRLIRERNLVASKILVWAKGISGHVYGSLPDIFAVDYPKIIVNVKSRPIVNQIDPSANFGEGGAQ